MDSICYDSLQWCHNGRYGVSNHQPHDCLLNRLFRHRSKKTSKLRVTGLCARNSPVTGEFPAQMASNAENVSIWWRHHVLPVWSMVSLAYAAGHVKQTRGSTQLLGTTSTEQSNPDIIGAVTTLNSSPQRQNGRLFADDIFICIFINEKLWILILISPMFIPKDPIANKSALVQVMAWYKPLPEPVLLTSLTHRWGNKGELS